MSKQPTSLDYSTNAQGLLKIGIDLAGQKAKALKHKPTGYEAEANLFKNIRAGMTGKRKPWHQTVSEGLINGVEYGLQSKQVEAKKADYDKVDNFFNYFEQTLACLNYDNNKNAEQTRLIENARPYAMGMLNNNFSGLSYEQANQSNQELFQQAKLNNANLKGDYVGFIQATDTLLIRRENGEILPFSLATLLPEDAIKDARQAQIDRQNANSSQMNAQAHMMSAETGQNNSYIAQQRLQMDQEYAPTNAEAKQAYIDNVKFNNDPQQRAQRAALEERGKKNSQYIFELEGKLQTGDIVLSDMEKLKNVIKDASISGSGGWAGIARSLAKGTGNTYSIDQAQMLLQSQLHEMKEIFKGATSDTDVSNFMKTLATLDKNPKASLERLDVLIERAKNKANLYRKQIDLYATDPTSNLFTNTANITHENAIPETSSQTNQMAPTQTPPTDTQVVDSQSSPTSTQNLSAKTNRMIMMLTPDGSMKVAVPEDQVLEALNQKYSYPKDKIAK